MSISRFFVPAGPYWVLLVGGLFAIGCQSESSPRGAWTSEDGVRWASLADAQGDGPGFQRLDSSRTGIRFSNTVTKDMITQNRNMLHGSGVAVGDVNGDDWPDLFVTQLGGPNHLYLNQGDFRFERVSGAGGAAMPDRRSTGTALADLDGEGDLDLIVTTMGGPNRIFHNDGSGNFEQVPEAGLQSGRGSTTMALADVNGDGDLDLYVGNYKRVALRDSLPPGQMRFDNIARQTGPNEYEVKPRFQDDFWVETVEGQALLRERAETDRLYLNDGDGTFTEQSWGEVFRSPDGTPQTDAPGHWSLVVRLEDLNGDGHPDLYVCNDFESPDLLYWGTGEGTFVEAEETVLRTTSHATMSIATSDVNRDGHTDFFLSDMLGRGYEQRQSQMPSQMPQPHAVETATKRAQEMQNTLQLNRGDATFAETAELAGVKASGWTWSSRFLDVDLDGYEDLIASTGHAYDVQNADARRRMSRLEAKKQSPEQKLRLLFKYPTLDLPTAAFRNRGDGTFETMPEGWGLGTTEDVGHGMATGDFDQDGDLDVVINRYTESLGVYRNEATRSRVAIRLVGAPPNTAAVGATVHVRPFEPRDSEVPPQSQRVIAGGEYLSDSERMLSFAVGTADSLRAVVAWPDGDTTSTVVQPDRIYEIPAPGAQVDWRTSPSDSTGREDSREDDRTESRKAKGASVQATSVDRHEADSADTGAERWFDDVSDRLDHVHAETRYSDFQRQPLLQRRLSQQGPGVAWADLDGDADDDLLIGTGRGGNLAYFRNDDGRFTRVRGGILDSTFARDLAGVVAAPTDEGTRVFAAKSNYERRPDEPENPSAIFVLDADASGLQVRDTLSVSAASGGALALADIDGDGDLDLFVGGRHEPGGYPADVSSTIFVNEDGTYERSRSLSRPFEDAGMVTGVSFADFDADGDQDLVLATEWGPVRYFENQDGQFVEQTQPKGLAEYTGFWRGVDVGDFNEDGRLDLVVANWGWNSKYGRPPGPLDQIESPRLSHSLRVYYTNFDRRGGMELLETKYHEDRGEYLPYQDLPTIAQSMSYVNQRISSYDEFSTSSLREILGESWLNRAKTKEAGTLSHMVFLNTEDGFEGHALPVWSQLSAGFSPTVADANGDGHLDVLLSQNFFATESQTPRQDAGRGLVLRGDGTGHFTPIKGHESGLVAYGEQRAAPVADIDRDGRLDLLVAQNGAETKLFRNVGATPGLRVRMEGDAQNPRGVGATVRLRYEKGKRGPAVGVTAGSGYWSQHSLTPILGHGNRTIEAVEVQWPDGSSSEQSVSGTSRSVVVRK